MLVDGMIRFENTKKAIELFYELKSKYIKDNPHLKPLVLEFKKLSRAHGRFQGRGWKKEKIKVSAERIILNDSMVNQAPWEEVKKTLLHEFAHAIDCGLHNHGKEWVRIAKSIGLEKPERTSDRDYEQDYNYKAYCSVCGKQISGFDRLTKNYKQGIYISRCCNAELIIKNKKGEIVK
jgi:predicted SprT family Zn-dependent metalloprotease